MKHFLALLATTAIIGAAPAAFAVEATVKSDYKATDNGGYKTTTSTDNTTSAGTDISADKKVAVDVDKDGSMTKTVKSKHVTDAKGLMNGKKDVSEEKTTKNADGSFENKATVEHSDAAGTDTSVDTKAKTSVDANGNTETTAKVKKTVDPKGLFNSKTTESTVKMKNGAVVKTETDK